MCVKETQNESLIELQEKRDQEELFHTKQEHSNTFKDTVGLEQEPCVQRMLPDLLLRWRTGTSLKLLMK